MRIESLEEFGELVEEHQAAVCAAAFGVTGDRALSEDIAQETFVAAWHGLETLRDASKLRPWLRGIARNLAHKARRGVVPAEQLEDYPAGDDPTRDAIEQDDAKAVWAALGELPATYREVLVLYYWEDLSARKIAEVLDISEANAMQRLSRGRAMLRAELEAKIERTLRRMRPGAVLTTTILAAVAASTKQAAAATAAAAPSVLSWKTGLTAIAIGICTMFGASISSSSGCGAHERPDANVDPVATAAPVPRALSPLHPAEPPSPTAADAQTHDAEPDEAGRFWTVQVMGHGGIETWLSRELRQTLSKCFVPQLVDHPAYLEVSVAHGKIANTAVRQLDGVQQRVVVIDPEDSKTSLAGPELTAWLAAGRPIATHDDNPALPDHARAMDVDEFVGLCVRAQLAGRAVSGPDSSHVLVLTGAQHVANKIDRQAYVDLDVAAGASHGPAHAPVTVVTFFDAANPYTANAVAAWSKVLARYPREVRIVVNLCPTNQPGHALAAEAAYAAGAQGALWPMLELIAAHPEQLSIDDFVAHATRLKLDAARLRSDLDQHTFADEVELDLDQMTTMEIGALPSAIVNGTRVHGSLPVDAYVAAVEAALDR